MEAVIIGLGSMGRRRARLLKQIDASIKIIGVDTQEERQQQAERELGIKTVSCLEKTENALRDGDNIAFVCTSPLSHADIITKCLERNFHTFTEINLVTSGYKRNSELAKRKKRVLFLSSTFLYRKETEYIKRLTAVSNKGLSYIYHVGQYLPDWHPWESYKDFFVGKKETNGCRELMAIEFPWLFDTFGMPVRWDVTKMKNSSLLLEYPDTFQIKMQHNSGTVGLIQIDVISRKAVRNFECSGEELYMTWDGTPEGLKIYDYENKRENEIVLYDSYSNRDEYSVSIIEDAYQCEIMDFLSCIKQNRVPKYSFEKDEKILAIIDDIEGIIR